MKLKVIDDIDMSKYIKTELSKVGENAGDKLILKILEYELDYLRLQGLVK